MGDVNQPDDDLPLDDAEVQSGLGRGLGAILAEPSAPPAGAGLGATTGGLSSLFAGTSTEPRTPGYRVRPGPRTATDPAPPPLPLVPRDERRARVVHPAAAPPRQAVEQR